MIQRFLSCGNDNKNRAQKTACTGHEKCTFHHDLELDHRPSTREDLISDMANSYRTLLSSLGENPNRQVGKREHWNVLAE